MPDLKVVGIATSQLSRLVEDYLAHCRAAGLSPKTVRHSYGYPLRSVFLPWAAEQGISQSDQLDNRTLDRFVATLLEQGGRRGELSRHSAWTYAKAVKRFLAWLSEEGEAAPGQVTLPKLPKRLVETVDRTEVQRLEDAALSERDAVILRTLADTGLRVGELVALRTSDLVERDRIHHFLRVQGKGGRERMVPISAGLFRRLQRYLERKRPADAAGDRIFVSNRRSPRSGEYEPLTESGVQQMIRDLGERAGLGKRIHPHLFRHSAATHMLRRGMNPLLVAQVLGHSSLAMIQNVYSHLTETDAHDALIAALKDDG